MNSFIQLLARSYPNIVQIEQLGLTHEKHPILVAKVGSNSADITKPGIWIDGGIHGREWISVSTVAYLLNKLVTGYANDIKIRNLVDGANWYMVPVLNVDGYIHTHTQNRMWRKNRRPPSCATTKCCWGVDLNRNFGYTFGGPGSSTDSCDEIYRGPSAFSEPESRAARGFILRHTNDLKAFISMHSFSQMWFYPYSDRRRHYPPDVADLIALSNKAVQALQAVHGSRFRVGTPADILYPSSGSSFDWAKGGANIKYTFGMELRPGENTFGNGFILPTSQIVPVGEETWAAVSVVGEEIIRKFGRKRNYA